MAESLEHINTTPAPEPSVYEVEERVTPTHSIFYAIVTPNPEQDSGIHICRKPSSPRVQLAFQALAHFLWRFFYQIRRSFDIAFQQCRKNGLEKAMWKGDWINQDFFNGNTLRKCSRIEFRFLHEPGSVDTLLDDIQPGTNWVSALLARDGLSLEMKFAEYRFRDDDLPGPVKPPDVHLLIKRAWFHECPFVVGTLGSELVPVDCSVDWMRLELTHSPTMAFPIKAYEDAYAAGPDEQAENISTLFGSPAAKAFAAGHAECH